MKSVFDGWTKKIEWIDQDGEGGFCAGGWLVHSGAEKRWAGPVFNRIAKWIRANIPGCPEGYSNANVICWANNEMKLDIEGFKMADLLSSGYVPEEKENELEEQAI